MKGGDELLKNNISHLRKKKNMSQKELAEKVGVSHWWINHIESGKRKPSLGLSMMIAKELGVKIDDIFLEPFGQNDQK